MCIVCAHSNVMYLYVHKYDVKALQKICCFADEADEADITEPRPLPQKKPSDKKAPVVIEVYENKTAQPRKSSLMVSSPSKMVRKRSVTIIPPVGIEEVDSSDDGKKD